MSLHNTFDLNSKKNVKNNKTNLTTKHDHPFTYDNGIKKYSFNPFTYDNEYDHYQHTPEYRAPYWQSLWIQSYDPYIKSYNIPILIPITNESSTDVNPYIKSSYASFSEPIEINVKKIINTNKNNIKSTKPIETFRQSSHRTPNRHPNRHQRHYEHRKPIRRYYNDAYYYYPFWSYYYVDPSVVLPIDLDSALVPIVKDNEEKEVTEKFDIDIPSGYKLITIKINELIDQTKTVFNYNLIIILILLIILVFTIISLKNNF